MNPQTVAILSNAINPSDVDVHVDKNAHLAVPSPQSNVPSPGSHHPQNPILQNEPTLGAPSACSGPLPPTHPLLPSFLRDLAPTNSIQLHLATRLAQIAHRQNRLSDCEFQVLQNEATRNYENKLIHWRQGERLKHIAKYGGYNKEHPVPEEPEPDEQTHLTLLAHAFSPTLIPKDAPASKKPPILSPYERYLKTQLTLDLHFLRLLKTYNTLKKSSLGAPSACSGPLPSSPSSPQNPEMQNKPTPSDVDVHVDKGSHPAVPSPQSNVTSPSPTTPKKTNLQIEPTPSVFSLQSSASPQATPPAFSLQPPP